MKGNPIKYFNDLYDARIKSMQGGGGDYATPDEWVDSGYPGSGREKRKIKRKNRKKKREEKRNKRKGTTVETAINAFSEKYPEQQWKSEAYKKYKQ